MDSHQSLQVMILFDYVQFQRYLQLEVVGVVTIFVGVIDGLVCSDVVVEVEVVLVVVEEEDDVLVLSVVFGIVVVVSCVTPAVLSYSWWEMSYCTCELLWLARLPGSGVRAVEDSLGPALAHQDAGGAHVDGVAGGHGGVTLPVASRVWCEVGAGHHGPSDLLLRLTSWTLYTTNLHPQREKCLDRRVRNENPSRNLIFRGQTNPTNF